MNKAIFLDRDGVINEMRFNTERNEYEPPFQKEDLKIYEDVIDTLKKFLAHNFLLFLISNQPDYAKGKTNLESLSEVHNELHKILISNNIIFREYYYCYHHPEGIIPEYSIDCECRKPKNYFVLKAVTKYNIDRSNSWFLGDRDKDVECGRNSGLKTIRVKSNYYRYTNFQDADYIVSSLTEASRIILNEK